MNSTILPVADSAGIRREARALAGQYGRGLSAVLGLHAVATVSGLAGPAIIGSLIDLLSRGGSVRQVDQLIGWLAAALVAQTVLTWAAQRQSFIVGERVFAQLREQFIERVVALPLSTVERAGTGDLITRTTRDVDALSHTVRFAVPSVLVALISTIVTVIATFAADWLVALPLLVAVPILTVGTRWYLRRAPGGYLREGASYAVLTGTVGENVAGARTIDALSLSRQRRRVIDANLRDCYAVERYTLFLRSVWYPTIDLSYSLPVAGTMAWGGWLVFAGQTTVGQVTAVTIYVIQLMGPVDELLGWLDEIQVGAASFARILGIKLCPTTEQVTQGTTEDQQTSRQVTPEDTGQYPAEDPPEDPAEFPTEGAAGHLVATDVRYAYRPGHDVLSGVSLDLIPGERLAVVGPSGAGKSTLGRLLAGIHPPRTGQVTVGGVRLVDLPVDDLRRQVALVTQEHHIFVGTLTDNLRLARPDADQTQLSAALAAVDAAEWVRRLPLGLETAVGSGGVELTPAQAQQVSLARLVLADPHTLVLDEATSLLDPRAARHLERSLTAVLVGRTVIAIAHRLHTAYDADRVAVIEDGRLSEVGTHAELMAAGGSYAALWASWTEESHEVPPNSPSSK